MTMRLASPPTRERPRIVGHLVRWDAMGPTISHPLACTVKYAPSECPHWRALNRGDVDLGLVGTTITRGQRYWSWISHDGERLILCQQPHFVGDVPQGIGDLPLGAEREIHDLLDAYRAEGGSVGTVDQWVHSKPDGPITGLE